MAVIVIVIAKRQRRVGVYVSVGVGQAAHTRHDAEDVEVDRKDLDASSTHASGQGHVQGAVVNAGHVASAAGLVFLGAQRKAVDVDAHVGNVGVVLEGLDDVEVLALALGEPIMAVQLQLSIEHGVLAIGGLEVKPLPVSGVGFGLDSPDQLLDGVVKVGLDLDVGTVDALVTSELQLVNQILMTDLCKSAALISIPNNTPLFSVFVSRKLPIDADEATFR